MKSVLIFFALTLLSHCVLAQTPNASKIVLKNGSVFKNPKIDSVGVDFYDITMQNGLSLRINFNEIKSLKFEDVSRRETGMTTFEPGGYGVVKMGIILGRSNNFGPNEASLSLHAIGGYEADRSFSIGVGFGIDQYLDFATLPIYLDLRGDITNFSTTPFYFVHIGHSGAWFVSENFNGAEDEINGKFFFEPGMGLKFNLGNTAFTTSMGYKIQKLEIERFFGVGASSMEKRKIQRLTWTIGTYF